MICRQNKILDGWIINLRTGTPGKKWFLTNLGNSHLKKTPGGLRRVLENQIFSCPSHSSSGSARSSPVSVPAGGLLALPSQCPWLCCGTPAPCPFSGKLVPSALGPEPLPGVCSGPQSTTPSHYCQGNWPGSLEKTTPELTSLLGGSVWF